MLLQQLSLSEKNIDRNLGKKKQMIYYAFLNLKFRHLNEQLHTLIVTNQGNNDMFN